MRFLLTKSLLVAGALMVSLTANASFVYEFNVQDNDFTYQSRFEFETPSGSYSAEPGGNRQGLAGFELEATVGAQSSARYYDQPGPIQFACTSTLTEGDTCPLGVNWEIDAATGIMTDMLLLFSLGDQNDVTYSVGGMYVSSDQSDSGFFFENCCHDIAQNFGFELSALQSPGDRRVPVIAPIRALPIPGISSDPATISMPGTLLLLLVGFAGLTLRSKTLRSH